MTQYTMICLILYLLTNYLVMAITPTLDVGCNFKALGNAHHSKSYKCPAHCTTKSRLNPPDLRRVELDYRICTHPDIGGKLFKMKATSDKAHIIILDRSRRKRSLTLVPQWQSEPEGVSVDQGKKIDLYCSIQSVSDNVEYEWYYSDQFPSNAGDTLSDLYNGVGDDSGTLSITSASSSDAGYYQCKVTDSTQDGDHVIFSNIVEVEIENYYLTTPSDGLEEETIVEFNAQDVLILECPDIESNPTADITWYKDDELYSDQGAFVSPFDDDQEFDYNSETYTVTKNSLLLMGLTSSDSGVYTCRATNSKTGQYFDLKEYTVTNYASSDSQLADTLPTILKENLVSVEEGSSATLYCLGVGHPNDMTYTWKKADDDLTFSDSIVQSDYGRQVTFTETSDDDDALYSCECSNSKGSTTAYISLSIEDPTTHSEIEITEAPDSIYIHDVYLDDPADIVIPCKATGADQIRFLKNGELLENSERYTFEANVGLTFSSYNSTDSGIYQCVAFNEKYWNQKMTFVMITEEVTASASADVTLKDSDATLSCVVTGYPYPDVTWSLDGTTISNTATSQSPYVVNSAPSHRLVIENIGFTDGGTYTCTAVSTIIEDYDSIEDYSHSAASEVTLTIEEEISISAAEESVTATVDDTLVLACTANGKPNPDEVIWYVNRTQVDTSDSGSRFSISTKNVNDYVAYSTLEISDLEIDDGGTYTCEATNTADESTTTDSDDMEVLVKYLSVTVDDSIREIAEGDAVTIVCSAQGSPTPEQIQWFLGSTEGAELDTDTDGYTITTSTNGSQTYISTLVVESQTSDQDYVCEATNYLGGAAQFDEVKILVRTYTETEASRETSYVSTELGVGAAMTCYCSGVPLPEEAIWKVDGVEVTTTSTKTITNTAAYDPDFQLTSIFEFSDPTSSDIADYTCFCENSYQGNTYNDSVTINFLVVTPVSMNWDTDNPRAAQYGEELQLTCTATGLPRPTTVVWSRMLDTSDSYTTIEDNDRFSLNETETDVTSIQSVLTISSTQYSDDGTYKCYADNKINDVVYSSYQDSTLLIYQNPTVTMGTTEYAASTDSSAALSCTVSSKPAPDSMEWYFGDEKIDDQPTSTSSGYDITSEYTVDAVTATTEGKYRCVGSHTYEGEEATGEGHTYVRLYRPYSSSSSTSPADVTTVNEYTTLNLTCTTTGVPEVAEFEWSIDSVMLTSDEITSTIGTIVTEVDYERSDLNIEVTSTLMIETVKYTNLGNYKCSTSQTWDNATESASETFNITVNFDAKLFSGTGTTEVSQDVGSQIRLTCDVYGNPAPDDISWKWADGASVSGDDDSFTLNNYVINDYKKTSTLQFVFLPIYHEKDIQCISMNTLSAEEERLQFTLNMNDDTMSIIQSGTVESGETVSLTCLTTYSEGAISWYKDNDILEENNRISYLTNNSYSTINSVLTIEDLSETSDSGNYSCRLTDGDTTKQAEYILAIGDAQTGDDGLSTGIIIALIVLVTFIFIVIILIIVVFVHGRKRRTSMFDEKAMPDGYENNAYDDRNLHSVISMPDTTMENLPKVVEPIILSKNELDHDVKEATIMQQATLTQQRNPRRF